MSGKMFVSGADNGHANGKGIGLTSFLQKLTINITQDGMFPNTATWFILTMLVIPSWLLPEAAMAM
jgi:hypothetical protein